MSKDYADSRFGVNKYVPFSKTASLAGTTGATELSRLKVQEATVVKDWSVALITGGTSAGRSLLLGTSLAGTGATVNIGTQALGTAADNTSIDAAVTQTVMASGDDLVLSVIGTAAGVYVANVQAMIAELFVNA